jgi:hypothetical protein
MLCVLFLAVSCSPAAHNAAPTPSPTPVPTAGPPRGAEPTVPNPPTMLDNRPTEIAGRSNGQMPLTDLVQVAPTCLAYRPAAASIARLIKEARAQGETLYPAECYRPIETQAKDRSSACTGGNCACAGPPGHSMHGWGKAVDWKDAAGSIVTTTNRSHRWLLAHANAYGWNHPRWAKSGPCPEPWHWEWVGDGGVQHRSPVRADFEAIVPFGRGYALCTGLSEVITKGGGASYGPQPVTRLVVGAARSGNGLLTVDQLGNVRAYGEAKVLSRAGGDLNPNVAGIAATPSGNGYWLVTGSGSILPFGDARSFGSQGASNVIGIAATRSGNGYWLLQANGAVLGFGDAAASLGGPSGVHITAIASSARGGYWLVSDTGRVFAFNGAPYLGSLGSAPRLPVVSIAGTKSGYGYWIATADGGVFAFGDAPYYGTG